MMTETATFELFGQGHLLTMLLILLACLALPVLVRRARSPALERRVAVMFGIVLLIHEVVTITTRIWLYEMPPAEQLPLHLCAITLLLVAFVLLRRSYLAFEVAYFWAMGGTLQAILTPDLDAAFPSFAYTMFFFGHGLVMLGVAYAIVVYRFRPTFVSIVKCMAATVAYAAVIGPLNWLLGTNYLYLCEKPANASLIDYLGPWPWYIASLVIIAFLSCVLWWLPFGLLERRARRSSGRRG